MTTAARCGRPGCGAPILWARTEAGKAMPIDPAPYDGADTRANLAVMRDGTGALRCRVITEARPLMGYEHRAMPHWATCAPVAAEAIARKAAKLPAGVVPFPSHRTRHP